MSGGIPPGIIGIDMGGTTTRLRWFGPTPGPSPSADGEGRSFGEIGASGNADISPNDLPLSSSAGEGAGGWGHRFPTHPDYAAQVAALSEALATAPPYAAVGVSVGARVLADGSGVAFAPNLRDYEGRDLRRELAARAGAPVWLAHDTVCGLLAEWRVGTLAGRQRCAYLTLSTGTGAAVGLRDRLISIEFGHQILDGNPRRCLCGQIGCLETYTGGRQIEQQTGQPPETITDPAFWETFADKLALGLINLAQLTRVDIVAVGGGMALRRPELLPRVQSLIDERIHGASLALVPAALGEDAPIIGASLLPGTDTALIVH